MSTSSVTSGTTESESGVSASIKTPKFDKCPRCGAQYDFLKRGLSSKVPLILNCKHTTCEDCIRRLFNRNSLFCPVCTEKIDVAEDQINDLPKLFPPHFALIGYLMWTKNGSSARREISWVSTGVTLNDKHLGVDFPAINLERVKLETESEGTADATFLELEKCTEHSEEYANVHCENCNMACCCYCFMEMHGGHKPVYMHKLNENELEELKQLRGHMKVVLEELLRSREQIKRLKYRDLTHAEADVQRYFTELHARLQLAERNVKSRLHSTETEDLDMFADRINVGISRIREIMGHFEQNKSKHVNLRGLLAEAKILGSLPCCLVSDKKTAFQPVELIYENYLDDFEDNILMKSTSNSDCKLIPIANTSETRENVNLNLITAKNEVRTPPERKNKDSVSAVKSSKTLKKKPSTQNSDEVIRVIITHVNDLNSFYVQKYMTLDRLNHVNDIMEKRIKNGNIENLKMGVIYGALYDIKDRKVWRRGKLIGFEETNSNDIHCKMFFVDYGNTQIVSRKQLKELDFRTRNRAPFAWECKLTNPDNLDFGLRAHLRLVDIIGEKELYMRNVKKDANGIQEIDLLVPASNGTLISVRELLAKKSSTPVKPGLAMTELRLLDNSKVFSVGDKVQVVVTYIRDPDHVAVVLAENVKPLRKLQSEMESHYQQDPASSCVPVMGTDVVVKDEDKEQGKWHRATVTGVDVDLETADVVLVDWGFQTSVSWSCVKLLAERFIRMESQAIVVKLADVEKVTEKWDVYAVNLLKQYLSSGQNYTLVISDLEPLQGALFEVQPAVDLCLNALLVEENYAYSTGPLSETIYWPNSQEEEVHDEDMSYQMIKKSEYHIMADESADFIDDFRQQVSVIKCKSPDLIYVKFQIHKKTDDELHQNLQIHYNSSRKTKGSWKVEEQCVVYDSCRKSYMRAVVKTALKAFKYLVYLYDHAREMEVEKKWMYVLDKHFKNYQCGVYKCCLTNIKPAGGDAGRWSSLALEVLKKIFDKHKHIFVKKTEINRENKLLGVLMWYSFTTAAKALEPSKVKYISINQVLIESGVAFSLRSTRDALYTQIADVDEQTEEDRDESKSEGSETQTWYDMVCEEEKLITNAVTWLKPYPLPKADFDAAVICVDTEGNFLVRDDEMKSLYLEMENTLTERFQDRESEKNADWRPRDMCTISYKGNWYRGTVISPQGKRNVNVEMIDFGSEHLVDASALSKYIMFPDIPPLVFRFQLYDVYSTNGNWTPQDIVDVGMMLRDDVRVVVKDPLDCDLPQAEVYLKTGESVNDLITEFCPHMYRKQVQHDESYDETIKDETSDSFNNCYMYAPLPPPKQRQKMQILGIFKFGSEYNVALKNLNHLSVQDSEEFIQLTEDISESVDEQQKLHKIKIGEPCVCFYPEKEAWGRAIICNLDNLSAGVVSIFFVDYGNLELVEVENLKVMRAQWFDHVANNRMAKIHIELVQNNMAESVSPQFNGMTHKTVSVEVVSEMPLRVHLYNGQSYCYQKLIDCGFIKAL